MDSRAPGFSWYVTLACGVPAASLLILMLLDPVRAGWWFCGELASVALLSATWNLARRRRRRVPAGPGDGDAV